MTESRCSFCGDCFAAPEPEHLFRTTRDLLRRSAICRRCAQEAVEHFLPPMAAPVALKDVHRWLHRYAARYLPHSPGEAIAVAAAADELEHGLT